MTSYRRVVWDQLKNITKQQLIRAIERDGWIREETKGRQGKKGANTLAYRHPDRPPNANRIVIHPHPKRTMSPSLLKDLLAVLGWTEEGLVRLKLIKNTNK